jgi:preprotein translocase subunit SecE
MAITDEKDEKLKDAESADGEASSSEPSEALATASDSAVEGAEPNGEEAEEEQSASSFGSERYVHAAFFVAGILAAYLSAKTIGMAWNSLAAWPTAVRAVPQLVGFAEEQRESYSLAAGAGIGTLVVVVASALATVYVTILDRIWSFLTTLVYGA